MPIIIPDEILEAAGMTEREALVEIACRLFAAGKMTLWSAARTADLSRIEIEQEILRRGIPLHRPTLEDLTSELETLDRLGI